MSCRLRIHGLNGKSHLTSSGPHLHTKKPPVPIFPTPIPSTIPVCVATNTPRHRPHTSSTNIISTSIRLQSARPANQKSPKRRRPSLRSTIEEKFAQLFTSCSGFLMLHIWCMMHHVCSGYNTTIPTPTCLSTFYEECQLPLGSVIELMTVFLSLM